MIHSLRFIHALRAEQRYCNANTRMRTSTTGETHLQRQHANANEHEEIGGIPRLLPEMSAAGAGMWRGGCVVDWVEK